jgi:hypothetical protein
MTVDTTSRGRRTIRDVSLGPHRTTAAEEPRAAVVSAERTSEPNRSRCSTWNTSHAGSISTLDTRGGGSHPVSPGGCGRRSDLPPHGGPGPPGLAATFRRVLPSRVRRQRMFHVKHRGAPAATMSWVTPRTSPERMVCLVRSTTVVGWRRATVPVFNGATGDEQMRPRDWPATSFERSLRSWRSSIRKAASARRRPP